VTGSPPRVSIAVPVHNEETVVPELLQRTLTVLDALPGGPHELVLVDDGSTDGTRELLDAAASADPRVVAVTLSRNFGHQAALGAALDYVTGDAVVMMDGDLQDRPEMIPRLVEEFRRGYDVVYARRIKRKENLLLRACYWLYYRLMSSLAEVDVPRDAGDFGLLSRTVVDLLRRSPERHRYWRGLRSWVGFRQIGIPIERDARHSGRSKYSARKLLKLALDGIFSFSVFPLRAATLAGGVTVAASLAFAAYSVAAKLLFDESPRGFTALIVGISFLSGVQLLFLGVVGEYVGRIYEQVKQRPLYIVAKASREPWTETTRPGTEICTSNIGGGEPENASSSRSSGGTGPDQPVPSWTSVAETVCSSLDLLDSAVSRE